jgi:hypothetical protein
MHLCSMQRYLLVLFFGNGDSKMHTDSTKNFLKQTNEDDVLPYYAYALQNN